jgi:hypothetical protein
MMLVVLLCHLIVPGVPRAPQTAARFKLGLPPRHFSNGIANSEANFARKSGLVSSPAVKHAKIGDHRLLTAGIRLLGGATLCAYVSG